MAIGPVPPYVNAAPQPLPGLLIGAALTFGIAAPPLGPALQSEYTFGTHTAVLVTAEAQKSQQWKSAAGGTLPGIGAYVIAGPAPFDPNVPAAFDPNNSSRGVAPPQAATYVIAGPAPFDPTIVAPVERQAPASGGARPRIGAFASASPLPFEPNSVPAQIFRLAAQPQGALMPWQDGAPGDLWALSPQSFTAPTKALTPPAPLRMQFASPQPLDAIQGWIETPMFNPQGEIMPWQDGAPGDVWALGPQRFIAQAGTAIPPAALARMQFASPQALDAIAPFDPNAPAKGGAVPVIGSYTVAAPQPFEPNSVPPQAFRIAAAPIGSVPLGQWATPQPWDVIQGHVVDALFNAQGPTIRAFVAGPSDPAPLGFAVAFTIERAGSIAGIGPVPPLVVTGASPVDPTPSSAQKFASAKGGSPPGLGAYQLVSARVAPETPPPGYSTPLVGPTLALTYQVAAPQLLDVLAAQMRPALVGPIGVVRPFVTAWPQPLDALAAQISAARFLPIGAVPPYLTAWPQQIDLTPPARMVRASVGLQGVTVRSFVAAPPFTDMTTLAAAVSARHTASMAAVVTVPIARLVLTGLTSIVLADYPVRTVLQ